VTTAPLPLAACLDDLESRIDESVEATLLEDWRVFCEGHWPEPIFQPRRPGANPPKLDWPTIPLNRTLDDYDALTLDQFRACSNLLNGASGSPLCVRANYGTPIMAVLFGCELFVMPESTNTLPTAHPIPGGAEAMRAALDRGMPSFDHPYIQRVFETGRRFMRIKAEYPKIGRHVNIYHPDLQGPFDIFEMIFGSEIFMVLFDEPELVRQTVELIAETYIALMNEWEAISPIRKDDRLAPHWGVYHRGAIMLRDDSAMNLSPEMFDQFVRPFDQQCLDGFGGGAMHACGRVDHFVDRLADMPGLFAFNMSQPELNDMEAVFAHTIDQGIRLIGFPGQAAQSALDQGRDLRGRVHCS
jgi:hypothetical protein